MKNLMLIFFLMFVPSLAYAGEICFTSEVAGRMIVEIEQCRVDSEILKIQEEANQTLKQEVEILKGINIQKEAQIKEAQQTINELKNTIDSAAQAYDEAVKEAGPGFFTEFGKALSFVLIGIAIGLLI